MTRILLFSLLMCCGTTIYSQKIQLPDQPEQSEHLATSTSEMIISMVEDERGIIATAGLARKGSNGGKDISLVLMDENLQAWRQVHLGRENDDEARQIVRRPEGGFLMVGYSEQPSKNSPKYGNYFGKKDGWVLWLDEEGYTEAELILGSSADDTFTAACALPSGGWLLSGYSGKQAWLVCLQADGAISWQKKWQVDDMATIVSSIALNQDGHIYLCGQTNQAKADNYCWIERRNHEGKVIWQKAFAPERGTECIDILLLNHHQLVISGNRQYGRYRSDGFLATVDDNGRMIKHQFFGGREADRINTMALTSGGKVLLTGESHSFQRGARRPKAWLVLYDPVTKQSKEAFYGGSLADGGISLLALHNGQWLMGGYANPEILQKQQAWICLFGKIDYSRPIANQEVELHYSPPIAVSPPGRLDLRRYFVGVQALHDDYFLSNVRANIKDTLGRIITEQQLTVAPNTPYWIGVRSPINYDNKNRSLSCELSQSGDPIGQPYYFSQPRAETPQEPAELITTIASDKQTPATETFLKAIWLAPNPDNFDQAIVSRDAEIVLQLKVISSHTLENATFCFTVNEVPCQQGAKMDEVKLSGNNKSKTILYKAGLREGNNEIVVRVKNEAGEVESIPIEVIYTPSFSKPNLHLLSIGIPSYDLKYTAYDAVDFAEAIVRTQPQNHAFQHIFIDTLANKERTTKTAILKSLKRYQYRYLNNQISASDLLIVFISSHGLVGNDGGFRIAASDYDGPFMQETSLDFNKELVAYLAEIPCQKIFVIDACHSGTSTTVAEARITQSTRDLVSYLEEKQLPGHLLLSCQPGQYSYEDAQWENGAFTEALIEGLTLFFTNSTAIDQNKNAELDISEWFQFVQKKTQALVARKRPKTLTAQVPLMHTSRTQSSPIVVKLPK